jgi:hypothetical protein
MSAAVWHETQWVDTPSDRPESHGGYGRRPRSAEERRDEPGAAWPGAAWIGTAGEAEAVSAAGTAIGTVTAAATAGAAGAAVGVLADAAG